MVANIILLCSLIFCKKKKKKKKKTRKGASEGHVILSNDGKETNCKQNMKKLSCGKL